MFTHWWNDWVAWWATVPSEFAFLLALPLVVALCGLAAGPRAGDRPADRAGE